MTNTSAAIATETDTPPPPPPRTRAATMTTDVAISKFLQMRDRIAALKKEHAIALAPFQQAKNILEGWLLDDLEKANLKSMRAGTGTVFKQTSTSATVEDWAQVLEFIKASNAWELLEHRVSKLAVEQILEDTKQGVPGVRITRETSLNVRRPQA